MLSSHFIQSGYSFIGRSLLGRPSLARDSYSDSAYKRLARELALDMMRTMCPITSRLGATCCRMMTLNSRGN
ncbi:hypothetical protein CPAR01_13358 [Colletotrichum paranaense]|uniref:Uncharacterized protein n=1 Tax=Colletotrichum paranaense TaxID=1914294 RepID=A0ABQ9S5W4_9PEZI|nr:uncharacterized protein CPAR01_13358 [Colletotrichum paranaense]KAK1526830.1 hypothetical protein CPAR01_13358 [Colletotrichum paranaense]